MEHDATPEAIPDPVTEEGEVPGVAGPRRRCGLHLDRDHVRAALQDDIHLALVSVSILEAAVVTVATAIPISGVPVRAIPVAAKPSGLRLHHGVAVSLGEEVVAGGGGRRPRQYPRRANGLRI